VVNPRSDLIHLLGRKRVGAHRHARCAGQAKEPLDQKAVPAAARDDNFSGDAAPEDPGFRIESKLGLRFFRAMTLVAGGAEDRLDVSIEVKGLGLRPFSLRRDLACRVRLASLETDAGDHSGGEQERAGQSEPAS
jgi:hypothetical protein